ncbi:MAG: hypothetical protein ACFHHU_00665 [Porticoccaceae bacterium]
MTIASTDNTTLLAGDIVILTAPLCLDAAGTHGVLVNAPSLKGDSATELCLVFESGNYLYFQPDMPVTKIGQDDAYDRDAGAWKEIISDVRANGLPDVRKYGFAVFECDGVLELQRVDEANRFTDDRSAANECERLAAQGNLFALSCLNRLRADSEKRAGVGRNGVVHDYHLYELSTAV